MTQVYFPCFGTRRLLLPLRWLGKSVPNNLNSRFLLCNLFTWSLAKL